MDNIKPAEIVRDITLMGAQKAKLPIKDILIRGFLAGAFLSYATTLAFTVATQSGLSYVGAMVFPVGFIMIVLLGLELVTGNFAIVPMAVMDKQITMRGLWHNWFWGFTANLLGALFFGTLFVLYSTKLGTTYNFETAERLIAVATDKTLAYKQQGAGGMVVVIIKAILCNWMVTLGIVMGATSNSTVSKIFAIWIPIFTFFAIGLEHSVVNMFVIPTAMMANAPITMYDWWIWNQIPVTLGNIVGGFVFTGLFLHLTYKNR
ncbi:MAG TPA: formate/nitrite transporter family protein [Salinivirgaceae bacterium]|nr:formate/nitrite transporter family protein [Salinivirgaceae bacterium]